MNPLFGLKILRQTRQNIIKSIGGLSIDQVHKIPDGFKNNVVWNLGHIVVTQQLLTYGLCNLPYQIPGAWIDRYRKGSFPPKYCEAIELKAIQDLLISTVDQLERDYEANKFREFQRYETSFGITLEKIEDVLQFIYAHDAFHWGVIASIRKQL